ncbi:MAG: hypothetical protein QG673_904 [Pseudomonadota bacterium]|nr:hypothetical protein [Pseudomonadota bacterium]
MELPELSTFVKLVETQSFTKTAIKLNITQATVSRRIQELEKYLGLQLVNRSTRVVEISPVGEALYQGVKQQEENLATLIDGLRSKSSQIEGTIRVSLSHAISNAIISPYIGDFLRQHPGVNLELYYQNHEVNLTKSHFDLAVIAQIPKQQTTMIKLLHRANIHLYCSPKYIEKYGAPQSLAELCNHLVTGCIHDDYSISKNIVVTNLETGEETLKENRARIMTNSAMHVTQLALRGELIIGASDILVRDHLKSGKLIKVLSNYAFSEISYYLIRQPNNKNTLINTFASFIEECFKNAGLC